MARKSRAPSRNVPARPSRPVPAMPSAGETHLASTGDTSASDEDSDISDDGGNSDSVMDMPGFKRAAQQPLDQSADPSPPKDPRLDLAWGDLGLRGGRNLRTQLSVVHQADCVATTRIVWALALTGTDWRGWSIWPENDKQELSSLIKRAWYRHCESGGLASGDIAEVHKMVAAAVSTWVLRMICMKNANSSH